MYNNDKYFKNFKFKNLLLTGLFIFSETAEMWEILDAFLAGESEDRNTEKKPISIPLIIPIKLIEKSGISENSPATKNFKIPDKIQVIKTPSKIPIGIDFLQRLIDSSWTKWNICFFVIPRQRNIPKKFVLWEILLLILLESLKFLRLKPVWIKK